MIKRLLIAAYEPNRKTKAPELVRKIVCGHLDASRNITVLSESIVFENDKTWKNLEFHIPETIDHFNIFEGLVTIYYKNGCFLEISRITYAE